MKKNLLKSLMVFLLLPAMLLVGCKDKNSLPKISVSRYFKDTISITRYNLSETSTESLDFVTKKKADTKNLSKYTKFELNAQPVWMYKMYIEKITFYVYCNESSESQMIINLKMTDLATEEAIYNSTQETVESETFEAQCTITPEAKKAVKCVFDINRAVIVATGSTLTIDILNSLELFSSSGETESNFQWMIYGFTVHGESRSYTR